MTFYVSNNTIAGHLNTERFTTQERNELTLGNDTDVYKPGVQRALVVVSVRLCRCHTEDYFDSDQTLHQQAPSAGTNSNVRRT